MNKLYTLLPIMMLTACGPSGSGTTGVVDLPTEDMPLVTPTPTPTPHATPTPTPTCKPVASQWSTSTTPNTQFLGTYLGPPTNGPTYILDLSQLTNGTQSYVTSAYDATHSCFYNITLYSTKFIVDSFQGCSPGVVLPGHSVNTQCDYCPYALEPSLGFEFDYNLQCGNLTITNVHDGQIITYH